MKFVFPSFGVIFALVLSPSGGAFANPIFGEKGGNSITIIDDDGPGANPRGGTPGATKKFEGTPGDVTAS